MTTDSLASIGAMSLLGEPLIDVSPATTGTPLKDGDTIKSKKPASQLSDVAETANEGIVEATALLKDIREGKGSVGKLFTEDKLYRDLNAFVESANAVTASINKSKGTLGKLTNDPRAYDELQASLANLQGDDPEDQRRRGEHRAAAEGRQAGEIADGDVGQLRAGQRPAEPRPTTRPASC